MGRRNYLIDGVSCSGKTSVATELERRGYHVVHGDRELAYVGDPETGRPVVEPVTFADARSRAEWSTKHWCWQVDKLRAVAADEDEPVTFFCGGSRNFAAFIDLFDAVFVLDVDHDTLRRRVESRPAEEWGAGGSRAERDEAIRLHQTKEAIPDGRPIDATAPLERVVDEILRACNGMINYTFAGLAVTDYAKAYAWYVRLFGRPADMFPHATEAVWRLTPTGAAYVVEDRERAGGGLLTVAVDELGAVETRLRREGIPFEEVVADQAPRRLIVEDADGNRIAFFEDPGEPGP